ncbi:hypothetical protein SCHPADRAFT_449867 [Schizopora paradoxa]|uniref:Late embryogenesis abundant protein LEA-2 subgroup domain-containing protein n=1 Tax=Schizopora paradoxa TaxID=27342 RepID=A0A0H2RIQ8_9AGAM|nr:hypothetical protein SCHPADRAFT_449867 [Schizopora paradoxa]
MDRNYDPYYDSKFQPMPGPPLRAPMTFLSSNSGEPSNFDDLASPLLVKSEKDQDGIKKWRQNHNEVTWTRGSRGRCIGRFCCCGLLMLIFLLVSVVFTLLLFIRPPNIQINNVALPTNGSAFQVTSSSLNLNLYVNVSVANPNYFQVDLAEIKADLTYPINNLDVGGGQANNIVFKTFSNTAFKFPFTLTYNEQDDPKGLVLDDILSRCGITGQKRDLDINYKITLGVKVLFVTISPSFSSSFSFECPITASDIADLLNGAGVTVPGISP